jgi:hypothetical protein
MPLFVFAVVLSGALLHATWNAIVKAGANKFLTTIMVTSAAAVLSAVLLPFLRVPASESWPFAIASAVFQTAYFLLLARTYQIADMSQTYPLMRGTVWNTDRRLGAKRAHRFKANHRRLYHRLPGGDLAPSLGSRCPAR